MDVSRSVLGRIRDRPAPIAGVLTNLDLVTEPLQLLDAPLQAMWEQVGTAPGRADNPHGVARLQSWCLHRYPSPSGNPGLSLSFRTCERLFSAFYHFHTMQ